MLTQDMKTDIVNGLLSIFREDILQIILYGSVAKEEDTSESDIDIAIILKSELTNERRKEFISWSADLDLKYDRIFSIIDINKKRLDEWGKVLPFYVNIQQEGISVSYTHLDVYKRQAVYSVVKIVVIILVIMVVYRLGSCLLYTSISPI